MLEVAERKLLLRFEALGLSKSHVHVGVKGFFLCELHNNVTIILLGLMPSILRAACSSVEFGL